MDLKNASVKTQRTFNTFWIN